MPQTVPIQNSETGLGDFGSAGSSGAKLELEAVPARSVPPPPARPNGGAGTRKGGHHRPVVGGIMGAAPVVPGEAPSLPL